MIACVSIAPSATGGHFELHPKTQMLEKSLTFPVILAKISALETGSTDVHKRMLGAFRFHCCLHEIVIARSFLSTRRRFGLRLQRGAMRCLRERPLAAGQ
jgi:hypothetical protein